MLTRRPQCALQRVGRVRVVDHHRETLARFDPLEPSRHRLQLRETGGRDACRNAERLGGAEGGRGIPRVVASPQRKPHVGLALRLHECESQSTRVGIDPADRDVGGRILSVSANRQPAALGRRDDARGVRIVEVHDRDRRFRGTGLIATVE